MDARCPDVPEVVGRTDITEEGLTKCEHVSLAVCEGRFHGRVDKTTGALTKVRLCAVVTNGNGKEVCRTNPWSDCGEPVPSPSPPPAPSLPDGVTSLCPAVLGAAGRSSLAFPAERCKDQPGDSSCLAHFEARELQGDAQARLCYLTTGKKPKCKPVSTWEGCNVSNASPSPPGAKMVCPAVPEAEERVPLAWPAAKCGSQAGDASCDTYVEARTFKGSAQVKLCYLTDAAQPKCKAVKTTPAWTPCESGAAAHTVQQ